MVSNIKAHFMQCIALAFSLGWTIEPTSCLCGGNWAWVKPRPTGAKEMVGCVCHTDISKILV